MGFRFSKRITILPGVRLNLSKSGGSLSVGPRGASVNIGKRGVYGNVGLPGTGLSWRERLDKPNRATSNNPSRGGTDRAPPAPSRPEMPDTVTVRLVDNQAQFFDSDGQSLDPVLIPAAKGAMKDQVLSFLQDHETERNSAIEKLRSLHHDIPAQMLQSLSTASSKPRRDQFVSQQEFMEALMTWNAARANGDVDENDVANTLLQVLGALEWPAETNISISLNGGRLLLDVDLPEIEDMPAYRWKTVASRLSLEEKPISQKDLAHLYLDHVCAVIVRLIGHSMAASSAIHTVALSAYTQRSGATGNVADEYVATVEVSRRAWSDVNLNQVMSIDPHNLLRHLGAKLQTNARGILLVQHPLN